jgi:hypothetical protein
MSLASRNDSMLQASPSIQSALHLLRQTRNRMTAFQIIRLFTGFKDRLLCIFDHRASSASALAAWEAAPTTRFSLAAPIAGATGEAPFFFTHRAF